jgi:hypothetical protein
MNTTGFRHSTSATVVGHLTLLGIFLGASACITDEAPAKAESCPHADETESASATDVAAETTTETSADDGQATDGPDADDSEGEAGTLCEQFCMGGCLYGEPVQECLLECSTMLDDDFFGPECNALAQEWIECMIAESCVELECWEIDAELLDLCTCSAAFGGVDSDTCEFWTNCGPNDVELECAEGACTCTVDGEVVGTCEAPEMVCDDVFFDEGEFGVFVEECCGVPIPW